MAFNPYTTIKRSRDFNYFQNDTLIGREKKLTLNDIMQRIGNVLLVLSFSICGKAMSEIDKFIFLMDTFLSIMMFGLACLIKTEGKRFRRAEDSEFITLSIQACIETIKGFGKFILEYDEDEY